MSGNLKMKCLLNSVVSEKKKKSNSALEKRFVQSHLEEVSGPRQGRNILETVLTNF